MKNSTNKQKKHHLISDFLRLNIFSKPRLICHFNDLGKGLGYLNIVSIQK